MKEHNPFASPTGVAASINKHLAAKSVHPVRYALGHLDLVTARRLGSTAFEDVRRIVTRPNTTRAEMIAEFRRGTPLAPMFGEGMEPGKIAFAYALADWLRFGYSGSYLLTLTPALELQLEHTHLAPSVQAGDATNDDGVTFYIEFGPDRLYPDPLVVHGKEYPSEGAYVTQTTVRAPFPEELAAQIRFFGGTTATRVRVLDVLLTGAPPRKNPIEDAAKPITLVMPDDSVNLEEWVQRTVAWHESNSEAWRQGGEPRKPHAQLADTRRIVHALKAIIIGRLAGSEGSPIPFRRVEPDTTFLVESHTRMATKQIYHQVMLGEPNLDAVIGSVLDLPRGKGAHDVGMRPGRLSAITQDGLHRKVVWEQPTMGELQEQQ